MLMGCTLGYLGGTPRKCARACVAVHRLGRLTHRKRGARRCTGALGELAPPEGNSTSTHAGFMSCGPSLRGRLRRDAFNLAYVRVDRGACRWLRQRVRALARRRHRLVPPKPPSRPRHRPRARLPHAAHRSVTTAPSTPSNRSSIHRLGACRATSACFQAATRPRAHCGTQLA
jgi:hypothetical protein